MPSASLKSMAKKAGVSIEKAEHDWEKAKEIVHDEYGLSKKSKGYWPLVVGVLRKMLGISKGGLKEFLEDIGSEPITD